MIVVHGEQNRSQLEKKYTLLELDTFIVGDANPVTNYAVVGPEQLTIDKLTTLENTIKLHEGLMRNYKKQDWNVCLQLIQELHGKIDPFMDSYYDVLLNRITQFMADPPGDDWDGSVNLS